MPRQPCPYEGCGCSIDQVWFWGWYFREDGYIPLSEWEFAEGLKLRRFMCTGCGRTFSWRPAFLAYGRRLAALIYQQALKDWAYRRRRRWEQNPWCDVSPSAYYALGRRLRETIPEPPGQATLSRQHLWQLLRGVAKQITLSTRQPRQAIHVLFIALARHRDGTLYRLSSS